MNAASSTKPAESIASRPSQTIVYPSAVDWWVAALLLSPLMVALGAGLLLLSMDRAGDAATLWLTGAGIALFTALLTLPCRYTLLPDEISIRCGVLFWRVRYADIQSLSRSSTLVSAPALSIHRVVIETSRRRYIVSPRKREQFMMDVRDRMSPV